MSMVVCPCLGCIEGLALQADREERFGRPEQAAELMERRKTAIEVRMSLPHYNAKGVRRPAGYPHDYMEPK